MAILNDMIYKMSKIDLEQLRNEIKLMQRWNILYKVLKEELSAKGFWKNRPRGNSAKIYKMKGNKKS